MEATRLEPFMKQKVIFKLWQQPSFQIPVEFSYVSGELLNLLLSNFYAKNYLQI